MSCFFGDDDDYDDDDDDDDGDGKRRTIYIHYTSYITHSSIHYIVILNLKSFIRFYDSIKTRNVQYEVCSLMNTKKLCVFFSNELLQYSGLCEVYWSGA